MATKIDISHYEFTHGRAPRGRGSWVFEVMQGREVVTTLVGGADVTYSQACRTARETFAVVWKNSPRYSLRVAS